MICPGCGREAWSMSGYCSYCGHRLSREAAMAAASAASARTGNATDASALAAEALLFSFGPFGVEACEGPYSIWKLHRRNCFVVELTDTRLCLVAGTGFGLLTVPALRYPWGLRLPIQVPYSSVTSVEVKRHPSPLALMEVLDVRYIEGASGRELSIAAYRGNVRRALEIITERTR